MAKKPRSMWDYVRAAFNARPVVPGMGAVPANWLAVLGVGVLGLLNPGVWIIGAGLELGYLAFVSHDPRFRKVVDASAGVEEAVDWMQRKMAIVKQLDEPSRRRYQALEQRCAEALQLAQKLSLMEPQPLDQQTAQGLSRLTWIFLRLLLSRQVLQKQLAEVRLEDLEAQIKHHEQQLETLQDASKERLRRSVESTLEIIRKRLAGLHSARENVEYINAELNRIEQQVALMVQDFAMQRDVTSLLTRVDSISSTLNETNQWIKMNADVFGEAEEDADAAPPLGLVQEGNARR